MQFLGYLEAGSEGLDVTLAKVCTIQADMLSKDTLVERARNNAAVTACEFQLRTVLIRKKVKEILKILKGIFISGAEIQNGAATGYGQ